MNLVWTKCEGAQWCPFLTLNLQHPYFNGFDGVYIIWHGQPNPAVVYVGQGNIRERITEHRQNQAILAYQIHGLYVTCAKVDVQYRNGIERFLADTWNPKVGDNHPQATPIAVNSPW